MDSNHRCSHNWCGAGVLDYKRYCFSDRYRGLASLVVILIAMRGVATRSQRLKREPLASPGVNVFGGKARGWSGRGVKSTNFHLLPALFTGPYRRPTVRGLCRHWWQLRSGQVPGGLYGCSPFLHELLTQTLGGFPNGVGADQDTRWAASSKGS